MPNGVWPRFKGDRPIVCMCRNQIQRQSGKTVAEAAICFLKGDNVCVDFIEDIKNTAWPSETVCPESLADIVACNLQHKGKTRRSLPRGQAGNGVKSSMRITV